MNAFAQPKMGSFPDEGSEPEARRRAQHRALVVRPAASTLAPRAGGEADEDDRVLWPLSRARSGAHVLDPTATGGPGVDGI
jgi:hypothetical protein